MISKESAISVYAKTHFNATLHYLVITKIPFSNKAKSYKWQNVLTRNEIKNMLLIFISMSTTYWLSFTICEKILSNRCKKEIRLTCMKDSLLEWINPQCPLNFQKGSYLVNHFTATVVIHNGTRLKSDWGSKVAASRFQVQRSFRRSAPKLHIFSRLHPYHATHGSVSL